MGDVITATVKLSCPHNFPIALVAAGRLAANATPVLTATEVTAGVTSCTADSKCAKVASVTGASKKLTIGGKPAAISPLGATTNIGPATAVADPVKLRAK